MVAALKAGKEEHLAKIDGLGSQECEISDGNRRLEQQLVTIKAEKDCHGAQGVESPKAVPDTNFERANAKKEWQVIEGLPFANWSDLHSAIEERFKAPKEFATTSATFQVQKGSLTVTSDQTKCHSSNGRAAEAVGQECMSFNWRNYIQTVFDQVQLSTEASQLSVKGDKFSLGRMLTQDIRGMRASVTKHLEGYVKLYGILVIFRLRNKRAVAISDWLD